VAGTDYPRDWDEFNLWFPDDDACRDYLDWLRWPDGFVCPKCGSDRGWKLPDGRWSCGGCKRRTSPTAGTIFDRTKTPLTTWFAAAWYVTNQKQGVSALGLKNVTGVSYQTAWSMLHKYRSAMVRPDRGRLSGDVEVDESYIGGVKPGKRGRGAHGKTLVGIAVELDSPRGFGRARMQVLKNFEAVTVLQFVRDNVETGSVVITDGAKAYESLPAFGYTHKGFNVKQSGQKAHVLLPAVHRVASLVKRWLLGTHQGAVEPAHLQSYLNEFCFRFNRRRSRQRGMLFFRLLELAVDADAATYENIKKNLRMRDEREREKRRQVAAPGGQPRAPRRDAGHRPWRRDGMEPQPSPSRLTS
jgi:transposase-like protein